LLRYNYKWDLGESFTIIDIIGNIGSTRILDMEKNKEAIYNSYTKQRKEN